MLAMHYIGDTDMKTMKRCLKRRDDRLREVADTWTTVDREGVGTRPKMPRRCHQLRSAPRLATQREQAKNF